MQFCYTNFTISNEQALNVYQYFLTNKSAITVKQLNFILKLIAQLTKTSYRKDLPSLRAKLNMIDIIRKLNPNTWV